MDQQQKVRTRTLGESGAWVEADKPSERQPKPRRFTVGALDQTVSQDVVIAEGVCFSDGTAVTRLRGDKRITTVYDTIDDVIIAHGSRVAMTWID